MRGLHSGVTAAAVLLASACRDAPPPSLRIVSGAGPDDRAEFVPRASIAEYIEVSPGQVEVIISLSSEPRSCEGPPASRDATSASVRIQLPAGSVLAPGSYSMPGAAAAPGEPPRPSALPAARLHGRRVVFLPGGSVELTTVEVAPRGALAGILKFEFPGDADHAATRLSGAFTARFCRVSKLRDN